MLTERILLWNVHARSGFQDFDWEIFLFKMHLTLTNQLRLTVAK